MKTFSFVLLHSLILLLAGCSGSPQPPQQAAMFRGNPQHTGVYDTDAVHHYEAMQWRFETDGPIRSAPAIANGTVYVGSGDRHLYAVDAAAGAERWRFDTDGAVTSSPAVAAGLVYFTSRDRRLYAVDAQTGQEQWRFEMGEDRPYEWAFDYYTSSPLVVAGTIYVGSGDGHLYAVDAETGQERWRFEMAGRVRSSPAFLNGVIYAGDVEGHLYALDSESGTQRWRFDTDGASIDPEAFGFDRKAIISSPALAAGLVLVGGRDGFLYAVDQETGEERWRSNHEVSWVISSPAIANGMVYVGSSDGRFVQAVDLETGAEQWRIETTGAVWSSLAMADTVAYFGASDSYFYAVDAMTGAEQWRFKTSGQIWTTPVIRDGVVYTGSDDGHLYALTGATAHDPERIEPAKAVYWEAVEGYSWFTNDTDVYVRDFFEDAGYEVLDAASLAAFMDARIADRRPSAVVFARNRVPRSVVADTSEAALFRRYLDAHGKVAWLGCAPLALAQDPATGRVVGYDFSIPERVVGVPYAGPDVRSFRGFYGVRVTQDGIRWGLHDWWVGACSVDADGVTTVLGREETGRAQAWVKNYGGPEGTGLVQLWIPSDRPSDLTPILRAAEYGLAR